MAVRAGKLDLNTEGVRHLMESYLESYCETLTPEVSHAVNYFPPKSVAPDPEEVEDEHWDEDEDDEEEEDWYDDEDEEDDWLDDDDDEEEEKEDE
jgi:hypothetical protein